MGLNVIISEDCEGAQSGSNFLLSNRANKTQANVSSNTLTAAMPAGQTNDGAQAEVDQILPPALRGAWFDFARIADFLYMLMAAGSDKIMCGQEIPLGGTHILLNEPNAAIGLRCFKDGYWHVRYRIGDVSIG